MALEADEKIKIRKSYFNTLKRLGWNVAYDLIPNCDDTIYDISVMLIKKGEHEKTGEKGTFYGFFRVAYNSEVSYDNFEKARRTATSGTDDFPLLVDKIHSLIYPYDLDEVVCQLLHLGYHIGDIYKVDKKGKLNLALKPEIIKNLVAEFDRKGSPLVDMSDAMRPKKLRGRSSVKTFVNAEFIRGVNQ